MSGIIKVLPPDEARKIAAGEVIDRPASLVREFIDNAIDAGGKNIELHIEGGGIELIEVIDDGEGMSREDMSICWLTHATSKIRSLSDLGKSYTLGFRGEALSAAAAVSSLEILSSRDGEEAWRLRVGPGEKNRPILEQNRRTKGTSIRAYGLYNNIPARKRFLKRPGSEAAACRQIFNEKAMAFPSTAFKYYQDGKLQLYYPSASSLKERFCQVHLEKKEEKFLHEINAGGSSFTLNILAGGPEIYRRDRRLQFVFANNRRIQDYALLQALEYGLQHWFPGGTHPIAAVFINIDPEEADFNIHPAKREVRFTDPGIIHSTVTRALRDFTKEDAYNISNSNTAFRREEQALNENTFFDTHNNIETAYNEKPLAREIAFLAAAEIEEPYKLNNITYLGRVFDLFILIEKDEKLFIIDQHAAHEAVLYEKYINEKISMQELLVPIKFSTDDPRKDRFLEEKKDELLKHGIKLAREDQGKKTGEWFIEALPNGWKKEDRETAEEILKLSTAGENFIESWMANICCHEAVKDGDYLDRESAVNLAEEAFKLPRQHCPHGRPLWLEISRDNLFKAVKRK